MSGSKTPMRDAFGAETTDRLAAWAIDALLEPPEEIATATTRLPTSLVKRGRETLATVLDWRALKCQIQEGDRGSASSWRRKKLDAFGAAVAEETPTMPPPGRVVP